MYHSSETDSFPEEHLLNENFFFFFFFFFKVPV